MESPRQPDDNSVISPSPPASPRLNPVSPKGLSTISSLAASLENERRDGSTGSDLQHEHSAVRNTSANSDDSGQPFTLEAHALMQMLSLVGSRLIEADQIGLSDGEASGEPIPSAATQAEVSQGLPQKATSISTAGDGALPNLQNIHKRRAGIQAELLDDQATPRGGHTPLAASVHSRRSPFRPISRPRSGSLNPTDPIRPSPPAADHDDSDDSRSLSASSDGSAEEEEEADAASPSNFADPYASLHQLSEAAVPTEDALRELSERLRTIFGLENDESVLQCYHCWLFRTLMLQGQLYLTTSHLLFYAHLPSREDQVVKAGSLRKRTRKTYRFSRHWAVLRGRALSWYDSRHDPYFPRDHIDLRDVLLVRPSSSNVRHFRIVTSYRTFIFGTESKPSRDSWTEAIQKAVFRARNQGENVRVSIPLEAITGVDESQAEDSLSGADVTAVRVLDRSSHQVAFDEYYFLNFKTDQRRNFVRSLKQILREQQESSSRSRNESMSGSSIRDSTKRSSAITSNAVTIGDSPGAVAIPGRKLSPPATDPLADDDVAGLSETIKASPPPLYPPRAGHSVLPSQEKTHFPSSSWKISRWIQDAPGRILTGGNAATKEAFKAIASGRLGVVRPVSEIWSSLPPVMGAPADQGLRKDDDVSTTPSIPQDLSESVCSAFSVVDTPSQEDEDDRHRQLQRQDAEWLRKTFALPSEEKLLYRLEGYLYRVLPLAGIICLSHGHICFLSSVLTSKTLGRTKMVLPLREVISCAKHRAYRFGHHGLVLTIRGHEELFLEFATIQDRDGYLHAVETQLESIQRMDLASSSESGPSEAVILTDLVERQQPSLENSTSSIQSGVSSSDSELSSNLSLLSFHPKEKLHFTLLTIGSRGDVQPFLSLARGLMADGHKVRIATHAEFGPWIEQHEIEFREIGGDPAELMRICVENGTFTVSFLREGVTKFRGWLDDLLVSCWDACQGTDVIIESPNALAGIHVAEKLSIPYFRSFTMPWSRTRAYPQAFAVPSKKAGGSYNYMSYVIFDQVLWRASAGQINRWRVNHIGLPPTNFELLEQHKIPYLYSFSPNLVPKPLDWYDWIHVTGFWFLDNPENTARHSWSPPADLVRFIEQARQRGKKVVYVGWGSITVPDAVATTRCVVDAIQQSGVCAILSKGWSERLSTKKAGSLGPSHDPTVSSDNIFRVDSVPHDWLFPLIDAACHHGGAGTIGASLRAGLPTIVKPWFGDQFFWGQQVESLGVGSCVKELSVQSLSNALVQATQNERQIERAKRLGEKIRAENGVSTAVRAIYADLEYATDLIRERAAASARASQASGEERLSSRIGGAVLAKAAFGRTQGTIRPVGPARSSLSGAYLPSSRSRASSSAAASEDWSVVSSSDDERADAALRGSKA